MIIGLDIGASAVKIVGLEGDKVLFCHSEIGHDWDIDKLLRRVISEKAYTVSDVSAVAMTGVGGEGSNIRRDLVPITLVPEIEATGEGGMWLAGKKSGVVVSIGTGTSLVIAQNGTFSHVGGSGVGSGTLRGLAKKLYGSDSIPKLFALAENGNRYTIDTTIADLFSGTDTLPKDLTASNFSKCPDDASDADWAYAVINMVMEVAGSHAALACKGFGLENVIITGGVSATRIAKAVYDNFTKLYHLNYIIPAYSDYATAIGAARRLVCGTETGDNE